MCTFFYIYLRIILLFFKLHGVMKIVEGAKVIHIVRVLYIELVFRPLSSSHPEGGKKLIFILN